MIGYTVHEQPDPPADRMDRADALAFVRDGFSFPAFLLPPVWLAAKRMWLALAGYLAIVAAIVLASHLLAWQSGWAAVLTLALNVLVGFEADTLERLSLDAKGWSTVGAVTGRTPEECERRFFDLWLPAQPTIAARAPARTAPVAQAAPAAQSATAEEVSAVRVPASSPPALSVWRRLLRGRGGPPRPA